MVESPKVGGDKGGFNASNSKTRAVIQNYSSPAPVKETKVESVPEKKVGRKAGRNKKAVSITIDIELDALLEKKQKETRLNKSILIEDAIRAFYKNE